MIFDPLSQTVDQRIAMRTVFIGMFTGWKIQQQSWVGVDDESLHMEERVAHVEALATLAVPEKDPVFANLIADTFGLFSHWSNDVMSTAPFFGVAVIINKDGIITDVRTDVPAPPSPDHYWDVVDGEWVNPPHANDEDQSVEGEPEQSIDSEVTFDDAEHDVAAMTEVEANEALSDTDLGKEVERKPREWWNRAHP